jgi:hypothetical protein
LKKETAEITKRAELARKDHEVQLKQEKDKLASMKAEEEKIRKALKDVPPPPQPIQVVPNIPAIQKEEAKVPKP